MKRKPITIILILLICFLIVGIIIDYFNRQSRGEISVVGEPAQKSSLNPFLWEMDESKEIESYSSSIHDFYFRNGRAYIYYKDFMFLVPEQSGRQIDIESHPIFNLVFFSKENALLIIRLFAAKDGKDIDLGSENIFVHKGWNRLYLNLREISFFNALRYPNSHVELQREKYMIKGLRLDFVNNIPGDSYLLLDFIRFYEEDKIDLFCSDYNIWGNGRNIECDGTRLFRKDKDSPAEMIISPLGYDSDVRKLYVIVYPKPKDLPIILSYRLYIMPEPPEVVEPDAGYWKSVGMTDGWAEIDTEGSNLAELKLGFLPHPNGNRELLQRVQVFYDRDVYSERFYPLSGLISAPYANGNRIESEYKRISGKGFRIIDLTPVSASFEEVNLALSKGYKVVGRIKADSDTAEIRRNAKLFKDFVSIWTVSGERNRFETVKKIIKDLQPDASVIYPDGDAHFIENTNKQEIPRQIRKLPNSWVKLDRGPVFFTGIVLIAFTVLIAFRKKTGIGFGFKVSHLKWFGLCLIASVVLLLPMVFLFKLGTYKFITFADITNALYRYGISAFLQELMRSVAIEYTVLLAFKNIKNINKKYLLALLITSMFFSLGHLGYPGLDLGKELSFLVITLFAGLIFGYLYVKTRSVTPPFILHLIADIFLFVFTTM